MEKKVKKNKKSYWSLIFCTLISIIAGIFLGMYLIKNFKNQLSFKEFMKIMAVIFITTYIWILIQVNVHEFGHFVFGKMAKFKLLSYRIGFLSWDYENGKMKFSIKKNKGYGGLCAMTPLQETSKQKYVLYYLGGLIFNFLSLIILIFIKASIKDMSPKTYLIFNTCIFITGILIIINGMPFSFVNISTDGKVVFQLLLRKEYAERSLLCLQINSQLSSGIRPRDLYIDETICNNLENINNVTDITIVLYLYFKNLDYGKYEYLKKYITIIEENIELIPEYTNNSFYYELIYYYCFIEFNKDKALNYFEIVKNTLLKDNDINGFRVRATYKLFIENNIEEGKELCEKGLEVWNKYPILGQAILEKSLIENILKDIGSFNLSN